MEEYIEMLRNYLGNERNCDRKTYSLLASISRGVKNKRFTWEQGMEYINRLRGVE